MTNTTAEELVDLVEARIAEEGMAWDFPIVIERLQELGNEAQAKLLPDDLPMLRGLARVLAEAIES